MGHFKYIIIAFSVTFGMASCESTLQSSTELDETNMVVFSLFAPDSLWKIYVTETKSIFNANDNNNLSEAHVNVIDLSTSVTIDFEYNPDGYFYTNQKPIEGHIYYTSISHDSFGTLKATNSVPSIENLAVSSSVHSINDDSYVNIEITPSNDEEKNLYYAWEIVEVQEIGDDTIQISGENQMQISNLVQFREFDNDGLSFIGGSDFNDSGTIIDSVKSVLLESLFTQSDPDIDPTIKVAVKLIAISNDMYHYYDSISHTTNQAQSSNTNQSEVHSNVIGGYGIFAGYKEKYIILN